eukprot:gene1069-184_t
MPKRSWSDFAMGKYHCQVKATPAARVVGLSQMLEAESRSAHQVKFEATLTDEPPAKKPRKAKSPAPKKVVVCPEYYERIRPCHSWCCSFEQQQKAKEHVVCCDCLCTYLLGFRLHGGNLQQLMCPAC